jgi:hypothetical protein
LFQSSSNFASRFPIVDGGVAIRARALRAVTREDHAIPRSFTVSRLNEHGTGEPHNYRESARRSNADFPLFRFRRHLSPHHRKAIPR